MIRKTYLIATVALSCPAHATILVNDTFSDTDRIGGENGSSTTAVAPTIGTPTSSNTQWIGTRVSQLTSSASGMLWTMDANSRIAAGYFPVVSLLDNTSTSFKLSFTTGGLGIGAGNGLRISLTDGTAAGIRTTDGVGSTNDTYVGDVGYGFFSSSNIGGTSTATLGMNTQERTTLSNNILGAAADWTALGSGASSTSGYFQGNEAYTMEFIFSRMGTSMDITQSITGGNIVGMNFTRTDTTDIVTTLDQINFRIATGSAQFASVNFTGFSVEQIAVPEPSAAMAFAGLALVVFRRRRA